MARVACVVTARPPRGASRRLCIRSRSSPASVRRTHRPRRKFLNVGVVAHRLRAGVDQQVDGRLRQAETASGMALSSRRALAVELVEADALDKDLQVVAVPARRHAEACALRRRQAAAPARERLAAQSFISVRKAV